MVDCFLGVEGPRFRQFSHEFGHAVPPVTPLPTDAITGARVEKDGGVDGDDEEKDSGVDGDDEDGRDDDGDSVGMLVEEDMDRVNCHYENGYGLPSVSPLDSEVYSQTIHADGSGSVGLVA